jgi:hypothetical protein
LSSRKVTIPEMMPSFKKLALGMPVAEKQQLHRQDKPYKISLPEVPITEQRKLYVPESDDKLIDPGTARATLAACRENPDGTSKDNWAKTHTHQTVFQFYRVLVRKY